jgi:hypothetical protein
MKPVYLIRYGLPGLILLAGVIVIAVGSGNIATAAGIVLIGVSALVFAVNVLARLAISSQDDREREQQARDEFSWTGRWPDRPPTARSDQPRNRANRRDPH